MSQDNGHGRNRDRDGEGRGPSAFNVLLWVSLVSLVILLGWGQAISYLRVELSPTDLQNLIKQSYSGGKPKTSDQRGRDRLPPPLHLTVTFAAWIPAAPN